MTGCNCEICQYGNQFQHHIDMVGGIEQRAFFLDMYERLNTLLDDMNYENAIADGSWPTSIEILETRLAKAKQLRGVSK